MSRDQEVGGEPAFSRPAACLACCNPGFRLNSNSEIERDRGRESGHSRSPPSKPDRRFSRIRLSSRWVLCREGAALRLVPKSVGQTFGITHANGTRLIPPPYSPYGHSRWFSCPSFCPSHFHLPAFPSLHGRDPLLSYYGRSDSRQPDARTVCPPHLPARTGLLGFLVGASGHSVSNHRCDDPDAIGTVRRFGSSPNVRFTGFASRSKARPSTPTESSSRRLSFGTTCVADWSFSFPCSPPRVATTQSGFDTARFVTAQRRTFTAPSQRLPKRTSAPVRWRFQVCGAI